MGRLFGTDGVRGVANQDLTAELALGLSVAAAHVLADAGAFEGHRPRAVVGRDPRASGEFLEAAVVAGLAAKSTDGAGGFAYPLMFLPFLSSAFVPTDGMPGPVRAFAEHQPVTPIVDTLRNLYAEQPLGDSGWMALGWCVALLVAAYALAMATYRRKLA